MNSVGNLGQLITNLPANGCVEVSTMIDRNGLNPTATVRCPPDGRPLRLEHGRVRTRRTAAVERSKEAAIHA